MEQLENMLKTFFFDVQKKSERQKLEDYIQYIQKKNRLVWNAFVFKTYEMSYFQTEAAPLSA